MNVPNGGAPRPALEFLKRVWADIEIVLRHAIGMAFAIVCMYGFDLLLRCTIGFNATFYDQLPIRYFIQTGDLVALMHFIWKMGKGT